MSNYYQEFVISWLYILSNFVALMINSNIPYYIRQYEKAHKRISKSIFLTFVLFFVNIILYPILYKDDIYFTLASMLLIWLSYMYEHSYIMKIIRYIIIGFTLLVFILMLESILAETNGTFNILF